MTCKKPKFSSRRYFRLTSNDFSFTSVEIDKNCWLALPRWKSLCHRLSRDQPQPGPFFQWQRKAEKRDPGDEVESTTYWKQKIKSCIIFYVSDNRIILSAYVHLWFIELFWMELNFFMLILQIVLLSLSTDSHSQQENAGKGATALPIPRWLLKVAQNSFQYFPRRRFWCVIITTRYHLMLQSWYQKTTQLPVNTLVSFSWHNRLP